jgi:hypothetical protein
MGRGLRHSYHRRLIFNGLKPVVTKLFEPTALKKSYDYLNTKN